MRTYIFTIRSGLKSKNLIVFLCITNMRLYIYISVCVFFCFCEKKKCTVNETVDTISVKVSIERAEQSLFSCKSTGEVVSFLQKYRDVSDYYLDATEYPHDSALARILFQDVITNVYIDSLYKDVHRKFANFEPIKRQFESAFKNIKYYYPDFVPPRIVTFISGFYKDVYFSDSLIVIGLEYFIGKDAKYFPNDRPFYIQRRFKPEYIVPLWLLFLSQQYNSENFDDNTLLNEMVSRGKSYYFAQTMLPCAADSILIGYTSQEMRDVKENQEIIWANFVQNNLLYETSHFTKQKFIGERPKIAEMGEKCPGRIAEWIGWEIINAYSHTATLSPPDVMKETNAKKILTLSKYQPEDK